MINLLKNWYGVWCGPSCNARPRYLRVVLLLGVVLALDFSVARSLSWVHLVPAYQVHILAGFVFHMRWVGALLFGLTILAVWKLPRVWFRFVLGVLIALAGALLVLNLGAIAETLFETADSPKLLLVDTVSIYIMTNLIFLSIYWFLDVEGQEKLRQGQDARTAFLFLQQTSSLPAWRDWYPSFVDYLYLSCNTFSTFGPTDVMNLSEKGRLWMLLQVIVAIFILAVLVTRVVTVLN